MARAHARAGARARVPRYIYTLAAPRVQ